jgi:phytoene dehydrogenase-like protein
LRRRKVSRARQLDVAIIGSGLGGMLCGALLGRMGYRVLIFEKLGFPGGRYTTTERRGFKVNTGSWAVGLHGHSGPLMQLLSSLGAEVETRVPGPPHAKLRLGGVDMPLPQKGQLRAILEAVSSDGREQERVMQAVRQALRWQEPSDEITCEEWLRQYTDNALIHGQFNFFSRSMTGTHYYDMGAGEYFRLLRNFGKHGSLTAMPRNGNKATTDALLQLLEGWKVDVLTKTSVSQILVEDGVVKGVLADSEAGELIEVRSPVVISDAGPKETVRLVGEGNFDSGYLREVNALIPSSAAVLVFVYDQPLTEYDGHIQFIETERLGTAWEPYHLWPGYAPEGRCCLYVYGTMKTDNTKRELELLVEECKSNFPGLEKAEVVASLVFKRDWPVLRARPSRRIGIKTPVSGLYIAGDAANPDGWTCGEGVAISCQAIAEDIGSRWSPGNLP